MVIFPFFSFIFIYFTFCLSLKDSVIWLLVCEEAGGALFFFFREIPLATFVDLPTEDCFISSIDWEKEGERGENNKKKHFRSQRVSFKCVVKSCNSIFLCDYV